MDKTKIIATPNRSKRSKVITIRITPEMTDWIKKKKYSPTKIFYEALREIGCPHMKRNGKK
jgi:hypothetical protein